jgi:hydrogenase maturation protease
MNTAVIVCIGNALVADDGVGWAVYRKLQDSRVPDNVRLVFLGLGGIDLLEEVAGEDILVVVDGVQLGDSPGTIHKLGWEQLPSASTRPVSGHGIGIREAISVGKKLFPERMPKETFLVGVEGRCFNRLGEGLTDEVARAVPKAVAVILGLVQDVNC